VDSKAPFNVLVTPLIVSAIVKAFADTHSEVNVNVTDSFAGGNVDAVSILLRTIDVGFKHQGLLWYVDTMTHVRYANNIELKCHPIGIAFLARDVPKMYVSYSAGNHLPYERVL
jgi:hypothetical protein